MIPTINFDPKKCTSEQLADLIIGYRHFGFFKEYTTDIMKELSFRRQNGDKFDYEGYIEENIKDLPKISFEKQMPADIINLFKNIKKIIR